MASFCQREYLHPYTPYVTLFHLASSILFVLGLEHTDNDKQGLAVLVFTRRTHCLQVRADLWFRVGHRRFNKRDNVWYYTRRTGIPDSIGVFCKTKWELK